MLNYIKRYIKNFHIKHDFPEFNLGTVSLILVCIVLIVISTFVKIDLFAINLFSIYDNYKGESSSLFSTFSYIPQLPTVLFITALLGPTSGLLVVFLYVFAGICGIPIFSSGGGGDYFLRPTMGYLLGFFPAVFFTAMILKNYETKFRYMKASFVGCSIVHFVGVIYMSLLMFFLGENLFLILSWFWFLTGMQFLYDFTLGIFAIMFGRACRNLFGIITDKIENTYLRNNRKTKI